MGCVIYATHLCNYLVTYHLDQSIRTQPAWRFHGIWFLVAKQSRKKFEEYLGVIKLSSGYFLWEIRAAVLLTLCLGTRWAGPACHWAAPGPSRTRARWVLGFQVLPPTLRWSEKGEEDAATSWWCLAFLSSLLSLLLILGKMMIQMRLCTCWWSGLDAADVTLQLSVGGCHGSAVLSRAGPEPVILVSHQNGLPSQVLGSSIPHALATQPPRAPGHPGAAAPSSVSLLLGPLGAAPWPQGVGVDRKGRSRPLALVGVLCLSLTAQLGALGCSRHPDAMSSRGGRLRVSRDFGPSAPVCVSLSLFQPGQSAFTDRFVQGLWAARLSASTCLQNRQYPD